MAEPHVERVIREKADLDEKLEKLNKFIGDPAFKAIHLDHQSLLRLQASYMQKYSEVLKHRLALFAVEHTK